MTNVEPRVRTRKEGTQYKRFFEWLFRLSAAQHYFPKEANLDIKEFIDPVVLTKEEKRRSIVIINRAIRGLERIKAEIKAKRSENIITRS